MAALFEVESAAELNALERAMLEAKFSGNANDEDVTASRFVADMAKRVARQLTSAEPKRGAWYIIDRSRREWDAALVNAVGQRGWWARASHEARVIYVRSLLAPFQCDVAVESDFIEDVEQVLREGRWYAVWRAIEGSTVRIATKQAYGQRPGVVTLISGDGSRVLHPAAEEGVATDWLLENGFDFVAEGVLPPTRK